MGPARRPRSLALAVAAAIVLSLAAALASAGCGSVAAGSEEGAGANGEQLFAERCGSCHTLAAAGTKGTIGPNLDDAIDDLRTQGFKESTIREMVRGQIAYPVTETPTGAPGMPPESVTFKGIEDTDEAADAVAVFVAENAGKPGAAPPQQAAGGEMDPKALFTQNCGSCHTLSKAGTSGTIGPNLDQVQVTVDRAKDQITNGGGGMPAFKDQLSEEQIQALAEFVAGG